MICDNKQQNVHTKKEKDIDTNIDKDIDIWYIDIDDLGIVIDIDIGIDIG